MSIHDEWAAVEKIVSDSQRADREARDKAELARELKLSAGRRARACSCTTWEHL
jgi:hypothetical protein